MAIYILLAAYIIKECFIFFKTHPRDEKFWLAFACVIALLGYFFHNLFDFSDIPQFLYFFLILGLLFFSIKSGSDQPPQKIALTVFSRAIILIFTGILVIVYIIYFNLMPYWADHHFIRAIAETNGNCSAALNDADRAIAWGGGNSLFYQGEYLAAGLLCYSSLPAADQKNLDKNLLFYLNSLPTDKYFNFAKYQAELEAMFAKNIGPQYSAEAEKDFAALALKYPQMSSVDEDWANFELGEGHADEAIKIAEQGIAILPLAAMESRGYFSHRPQLEAEQFVFYDILGQAEVQKKDFVSALDYYQKIISINSSYFPAYKKIADIYYQQNNLNQALWYNQKGYQLDPGDYSWPLAIGLLYRELGQNDKALDYFDQALKIDPSNQEAQSLIKEINK